MKHSEKLFLAAKRLQAILNRRGGLFFVPRHGDPSEPVLVMEARVRGCWLFLFTSDGRELLASSYVLDRKTHVSL